MSERNTSGREFERRIIAFVKTALGLKANSADLARVATTGSYNDLSDKPTIPNVPSWALAENPPTELPAVTASDNGKVLAVNNGEWSADSPVIVSGTDAQVANAVNDYLTQYGVPLRLSEEIKQALLDCFENVAWINDQGQTYYDALYAALYPPVDVLSISAVFTQGSAVIYDTDSLDTLKQYLVVTATMTDSTTQTVADYTLSGTLTEGTSTITVSYGDKTATFNVTVSHVSTTEYALHQDAGYTGQINFGLSPQDDGVAKIEVTLDLPTYTGSTNKVLFNFPGWIGFNNTDWKYNNSTTTPPEKVNRALSAVMGQGKQTVVFDGWKLGGSWGKITIGYGTASFNPEVTWYEIKMYDSNDVLVADWKPTSTTGEFYDSIGNRTVTASVTAGLEVIEVTT